MIRLLLFVSSILIIPSSGNPTSDLKSHKKSIPCDVRTNHSVNECKYDYEERKSEHDLNPREECCAVAKLRHCIKDILDDDCLGFEAEQEYLEWRKDFDGANPILATRCLDDSHDTLECIFLNFMVECIVSFSIFILLVVLLLITCVWLIFCMRSRKLNVDF